MKSIDDTKLERDFFFQNSEISEIELLSYNKYLTWAIADPEVLRAIENEVGVWQKYTIGVLSKPTHCGLVHIKIKCVGVM